ncbi:MAG: hypothetical protein AB7V58_00520 [Solirubrobacterales bacterium]
MAAPSGSRADEVLAATGPDQGSPGGVHPSAGVVLVAAGLYLPNGWPLVLGGFVLLLAAVASQL